MQNRKKRSYSHVMDSTSDQMCMNDSEHKFEGLLCKAPDLCKELLNNVVCQLHWSKFFTSKLPRKKLYFMQANYQLSRFHSIIMQQW